MQRRHRTALATVLVIALGLSALGACDRSTPAPTGTLEVAVAGLPEATPADVVVTGPDHFLALLETSTALSGLTPGDYDVIAQDVLADDHTYAASIEHAPVRVHAGESVSVNVTYVVLEPEPHPDPDPEPEPHPDQPAVDAVTVVGHDGSLQARQGAGTLALLLSGSNLATVDAVTLGDLTVALAATSATSVEVEVLVPHGAALGPRTLELSAPAGAASFEAALEVSAITSGPGGSDASGRGTPDSPFRSLTFAVAVAEPGDTVGLLAGSYGAADGEAWPLVIEDLVVTGARLSSTFLAGDDDSVDGLDLRGTARLEDVSLSGFRVGVRAAVGAPELNRVRATGNALHGLQSGGPNLASLTVTDSSFSANGQHGVNAPFTADASVLSLASTTIEGNLEEGLVTSGSGSVTVSDSIVRNNNFRGVALGGSVSMRLERTQVIDSNLDGILATGASDLVLIEVEVRGSLRHGVDRAGTGRLEMRHSQVRNNLHDGVVVRNAAVADLGSALEPGGNSISASALHLGALLADERQANSEPPIAAYGLELVGMVPPPAGVATGRAEIAPYWRIANAGNAIDFGP